MGGKPTFSPRSARTARLECGFPVTRRRVVTDIDLDGGSGPTIDILWIFHISINGLELQNVRDYVEMETVMVALTRLIGTLLFPSTYQGMVVMVLLIAGGVTPTSTRAGDVISPVQKFHLALEAQTEGRYEEMVTMLREAGNAGHLGAQEMLPVVLLGGPTLYGPAVTSNRCEAEQWILRALAQGSNTAQTLRTFLIPLRYPPEGLEPCEIHEN